jgi:hypothetical protein
MITEREIRRAEKEEKLKADAYLKGITDFVKWTSTLAIAAVLWVANGLSGQPWLSWTLSMTSLGLLLAALAIAVLSIHRVLMAMASEWSESQELHRLCLQKKLRAFQPEKGTEDKEIEQIDRLLKAIETSRLYSGPKGFNQWVLWYIGILLGGLVSNVLARGLS